ncbi:MAG: BON domain-containing protein [Candidatus Caenarcaniphilales bacterium]|nr:BON domain-containing protein [Candidatus Caenarcaniphilales bacterium]
MKYHKSHPKTVLKTSQLIIIKLVKSLTILYLSFVALSSSSSLAGTFGQSVKRNTENVTEKAVILGHKTGSKVTDASITSSVKTSLITDPNIEAYRINVDTKKRVVYLKGEVPNRSSMIRAVNKAKRVKGVRAVINMLSIYP